MTRSEEKRWKTFSELIAFLKSQHGDDVAFQYKVKKEIKEKRFLEFSQDIQQTASSISSTYGQGQRIALIGTTSYQWLVTYVATIISGGVAIPLDSQLPLKAVKELLERAEADLVFYDEGFKYQKELVADLRWQYIGMNSTNKREGTTWESLNVLIDKDVTWIPKAPEETSVILYTSGTTGKSKGVCLSQKSILAVIQDSVKLVQMEKGDKVLSILPVNHAYELHCGIFPILSVGGTVAINDSLRNISANLQLFKPNSLFIVPLIADKLYQNIWEQAEETGKAVALRKVIRINNRFKKVHLDFSNQFFKPVKASFGGALKRIVCGGAKLNPKIAQGFTDLGINFSEGYGITECAPLVSVNPEKAVKMGSLGLPLAHCQVMILKGEILVKGDILANGYYQDPDATAEAFLEISQERWFKTGDLGYLDKDGYLFISGRKKNLIILGNGENISPEELEVHVSDIEGVKEVIVYQKNQKIVAKLHLENSFLETDRAETLRYLKQELTKINKELPVYQRIADIEISDKEFEKTTTQKIKREAAVN